MIYFLEIFIHPKQQEECSSAINRQSAAATNNRMTMEWERANLSLKPGSDTKANVITVSEKNTTTPCLSAPADTAHSKRLTDHPFNSVA